MSEKYKNDEITIRQANREDMKAVAEMIQELADFEEMPDGPKIKEKDLERDGFERQPPAFRCKVAELVNTTHKLVVGYAIYFSTYSTWQGLSMMLEDLYVRSDHRRRGVGQKLLHAVIKEASEAGCSRLDFHVLEWNPARSFYEGMGAVNLTSTEQWCYYRLSGNALHSAAAAACEVYNQ